MAESCRLGDERLRRGEALPDSWLRVDSKHSTCYGSQDLPGKSLIPISLMMAAVITVLTFPYAVSA